MKKHTPIPSDMTEIEVRRFWRKVKQGLARECWDWQGCQNSQGYGQYGLRYKVYLTHRIAWAITKAEDPGNNIVCHRCDNPICCNPGHLFLGTQLDNMRDMIKKGRADHSTPTHGDFNGNAKLSEADVLEIHRLHAAENLGARKLAKRYKVTPASVTYILQGKTWKHLFPGLS